MLKCHNGSVWKVTWAHPEFGQIIATCSFDRTALIWEETVGESSHGMPSTWYRRASLVDSKSSVTDVKFAPKAQGLILAACSADGLIRIYEATDVMNLNHWSLMHEIQTKLSSCSCLSWNPSPSRIHPPLIAVGSDDQSGGMNGKVLLFEYSDNLRKWTKVETILSVTDPVHDIAFSPNLGRSYHLLAIATKDVRIITVKPIGNSPNQSNFSTFEVRQAGQFDDHGSTVWRVSWNMTGTILASSGEDGCVRLWKANYLDLWKCISVLKGEEVTACPSTVEKRRKDLGKSFSPSSNSSSLIRQTTTPFFQLAPSSNPS
ncbi:UNVERIFIED_CONTAM: hypothetical protein GTU68_005239, partial [Idotea baltica]|nr:hypothetical protein [Idotea baltica]